MLTRRTTGVAVRLGHCSRLTDFSFQTGNLLVADNNLFLSWLLLLFHSIGVDRPLVLITAAPLTALKPLPDALTHWAQTLGNLLDYFSFSGGEPLVRNEEIDIRNCGGATNKPGAAHKYPSTRGRYDLGFRPLRNEQTRRVSRC